MFFQPLEQFEVYVTEFSAIFHFLKIFVVSFGFIIVYKFLEIDIKIFIARCITFFDFYYDKFFYFSNGLNVGFFKNKSISNFIFRLKLLTLEKFQTHLNILTCSSILDKFFNKFEYIIIYSHARYASILYFIYWISIFIMVWSGFQLYTIFFGLDFFDLPLFVVPFISNFELLLFVLCIWYYLIFTFSTIHWENSFYDVDFLLPTKRQAFIESIYIFLITLLVEQAGVHAERYFSMICSIFIMILLLNCLGLIPCSFALTSHIIVTFTLGISVLILLIALGFVEFQYAFFTNFLPKDIHVSLLPFLFFIELVSFLSRGLSLSIRLFANIMSGHTLLNILSSFLGIMLSMGLFSKLASLLLVFVILVVCVLEFSLAFIQAYVFTVLTCIYLKDSLHLHNYDLAKEFKESHNKLISPFNTLQDKSNGNLIVRNSPYIINFERRCHISLYCRKLVFRND